MIHKLICHITKVLPLIYDESLSYYETLCKLINKVNEIIEYTNKLTTDALVEIIGQLIEGTSYDAETMTLTITFTSADESEE